MSIRYGRLNTKAIVFVAPRPAAPRPRQQAPGRHRHTGRKADRRARAGARRGVATRDGPCLRRRHRGHQGRGARLPRRARRDAGGAPLIVDVGTRAAAVPVDVPAAEVAAHHPAARRRARPDDRGTAVTAMGEAFAAFVRTRDDIDAIVGIGGGGGTSIVTAGMRALPFGVPKLMVSTLASGDVGPYVGVSDITMMHSVADIAGLNRITRTVLAQAAARHRRHDRAPAPPPTAKPAARPHHVRRHHALRHPRRRALARRLRLPGLPRHRHRRPRDGEARRQRHARRA